MGIPYGYLPDKRTQRLNHKCHARLGAVTRNVSLPLADINWHYDKHGLEGRTRDNLNPLGASSDFSILWDILVSGNLKLLKSSIPENRMPRASRSVRSRRGGLNLDLNDEPPVDNPDQVAMCSNPHFGVAAVGVSEPPTAPIDLEALDDDVIVSSPRAFAEAKNKSQRNHERAVVVNLDSVTQSRPHKRRRASVNQTSMNSGIFINLEASINSAGTNAGEVLQPPPPPPPKEPTFNCPVCMGPLVEEMSTKCGHIFCKECIKAAIAAQKKCPTCRRKVTPKDIIRVYLPATTCS